MFNIDKRRIINIEDIIYIHDIITYVDLSILWNKFEYESLLYSRVGDGCTKDSQMLLHEEMNIDCTYST